ncbi:MAG: c-type cytochrome [Nannocystales bacterium]
MIGFVGIVAAALSVPVEPVQAEEGAAALRASPWSDAWLLDHSPLYLDNPQARRSAMERSLATPDNLYSAMRISAYGRGRTGWDVLPAWNPSSQELRVEDLVVLETGRLVSLDPGSPRLWDGRRPQSMDDWVKLGREVFFRFPLRPEPAAELAFATGTAERLGLEHDRDGKVPGLVAYRDVDGGDQVGITCALCHTAIEGGQVVVGRARRALDYGAMRLAYEHSLGDVNPGLVARMSSWGPGRADITEDDDQDPVSIPDLWRLRELRNLTQAATIVHDSPLALAIRQETQMLHASGERVRPPRELAWALAMYLYSLTPPTSGTEPTPLALKGKALFASHCARCHSDENGSGRAVLAIRVGTDPALANGRARGTGNYRPAPLVDVRNAAPYLHTGEVGSLEDLLGSARLRPDFDRSVRGPGSVLGHDFGTDLPPRDRAALAAWLRTL